VRKYEPNGFAGGRPKSPVRNFAEARLSRTLTMVWFSLIDMAPA